MDSNSEAEAISRNSPQDKSNGSGQTLIQLEGVTKVFYTEEVETHALSGIHLQIKKGEYLSIAGPSGCGNPPCSPSWGCSIHPPMGSTL